MRIIPILAAGLLFAQPGVAEESIKPNTPFHERELPRAEVSGALVVGVHMRRANFSGRGDPLLASMLPASMAAGEAVCVEVTAKDGTYESRNIYVLPAAEDDAARRVTLEYPTGFGDRLKRVDSVVRLRRGTCDDPDAPLVPVDWNAVEPWDGNLIFFVNTGGADTLIAIEGRHLEGGEFVTPCVQIEEVNGLKYTARCTVPASKFPPNEETTVYLDVLRNGVTESYDFKVLRAGP